MRSAIGVLMLAFAGLALADDPAFELAIRDHRFFPSEIAVPAGQRIKLVVKNEDATPEEFESKQLNREKVVPGKSQATIFVGPLKPGEYSFVGEYHEKTAIGKLVAR